MSQEEEKEENLSTIEVEKTVFQKDTVAPEFYGDERSKDENNIEYLDTNSSQMDVLGMSPTPKSSNCCWRFLFFVSFLSTHIKTGF